MRLRVWRVREEHRVIPAYEKPRVSRGDAFFSRARSFAETLAEAFAEYFAEAFAEFLPKAFSCSQSFQKKAKKPRNSFRKSQKFFFLKNTHWICLDFSDKKKKWRKSFRICKKRLKSERLKSEDQSTPKYELFYHTSTTIYDKIGSWILVIWMINK